MRGLVLLALLSAAGALLLPTTSFPARRLEQLPMRRGFSTVSWPICMAAADDDEDDAAALLAAFLDGGGAITDSLLEEGAQEIMDGWVDDDDDDVDEEAMLERARAEEQALKDAEALPLQPPAEHARVLATTGVVRVADALSTSTAAALREHVLGELLELGDAASKADCGSADSVFSSVLSPIIAGNGDDEDDDEDEAAVNRRWDLRLRLTPTVRRALRELMAGSVGELLEASAGADAELFELAALIAAPGAEPQPLHSDTLWNEDGCFFTAFVALQAVSRPMGPTRFLLGTHADAATHEAFEAGQEDGSFLSNGGFTPACGLLEQGEATVYDGRLLHAGSANVCDAAADDERSMRILFYVTAKRAAADPEELANEEAHSLLAGYRGRLPLVGALRRSALSRAEKEA